MRIIREDDKQLIFTIYPSKVLSLGILILLAFLIYRFLHPVYHIDPFANYGNTPFSDTLRLLLPDYADQIITAIAIIGILIYLIPSYLFPLRVTIDKQSGKLTYRFFFLKTHNPVTTIEMQIHHLKKLSYTDSPPEFNKSLSDILFFNNIGKFCFISDNHGTIPIYTGDLFYFYHEVAFKKIAAYLNIPYETKELKNLPSPSSKIIRIMVSIMVILVIIVAAMLGLVFFLLPK